MAITRRAGVAAAAVLALCLAAFGSLPAHAAADEAAVQPDATAVQVKEDAGSAAGRRGLRGCCHHKPPSPPPPYWTSPPPPSPPPPYWSPPPSWWNSPPPYYSPPPSWSSPPTWSSPPSWSSPWPYYPPPYYSWNTFPYTQDCYFDSTGVYKIVPKGWSYPKHDYTRYCFWITAKQPDPYSHKQCRNFDLWSVNFRVHHDCENQVSDLTWNGQPLTPVWAQNLPSGKSMLQVTRGGNSILDTQSNIASHKAKICFTLPNWCPLNKFCKDNKCKAAFYPSPYTGLKCCPSWDCYSKTSQWT